MKSLVMSSCVWVTAGCGLAHAQTYTVVELPSPPGAVGVVARAINGAGHVAGEMSDTAGNLHPVTWVNGVASVLALPPGYPGAGATGISDSDTVCGTAWTQGSFGLSAAVIWQAGSPAFIPTLGGQYSAADGISASSVLTGWTSMSGQFTGQRAYRFDSVITSAGVLPGGGGSWTVGKAVNASGQIVGMGMNATGFERALLDDPAEGMIDLGTLGGLTSEAIAISSAGHVAGWSQTGERNTGTFDGILVHAFLWHKGRMTDLGALTGTLESRATGVNAGGIVVGRSPNLAPASAQRAFVWSAGVMTDLNAAIPAGSGWILESAYAINDAGRIVGAGRLNGQPRAFLLIPIP